MKNCQLIFSIAVLSLVGSVTLAHAQAAPENLRLSNSQIARLKQIKTDSDKKVAPLALQLAATARQVYENLLSNKENQKLRRRLSSKMNRIGAHLLAIKGQSIRDSVAVLTREQKALLRTEMRKPDAPADLTELISQLFAPATK